MVAWLLCSGPCLVKCWRFAGFAFIRQYGVRLHHNHCVYVLHCTNTHMNVSLIDHVDACILCCLPRQGLGCRVIAHDIRPSPAVEAMGIPYLPLEQLLPQCDIVTLHCPLLPSTYHLIDDER